MTHTRLIGPFTQLLPLRDLPLRGPLSDDQLEIIPDAGIVAVDGRIAAIGPFEALRREARWQHAQLHHLDQPLVALPGFIDAHTHICYAGSRAGDYARRLAGQTYLDIARAGGGIRYSVAQTRAATEAELAEGVRRRAERHLAAGVTTIEVKSGYGLSVKAELKMLRAIRAAADAVAADLVSTCLAAHVVPAEFDGRESSYLDYLITDLLPLVRREQLAGRVDIFVEESAFSIAAAERYLVAARAMGFDLTVHADQFHAGGSALAVRLGAVSADHLEASTAEDIERLGRGETVAVALPGASLGLGERFAPARRLLDAGACVAIASDWNPGSAPMGELLPQAAILGAYEKLTMAETLAGLTFRAAHALRLHDRGTLSVNALADVVAFPTADYREILYQQGQLRPEVMWKRGERVKGS